MECYYGYGNMSTDKISDDYIYVNNFGYSKNIDKDFSVIREKGRLDYQIIYIDKGYGHFLIDDELIKIESGNIVVLCPGKKNFYKFSESSKTDYYWIHFTGSGIAQLLTNLKLEHSTYCTGNFFLFKESIEKMSKACAVKDFTTESFLCATMISLLCAAAKQIYIQDTSIHKVIEKMHKDKFNMHSISDYAKMCGINECHFIKKFRQITGMTPHQYKVRLTVNKAIELLNTSNLNISEIAYIIGFEDSLYFSRLFKKEVGLSPRAFKQQTDFKY